MMKKLFTILMIVGATLFSSSVKAQITSPYLDSTSKWYEWTDTYFTGISWVTTYSNYYFDGDTVISAKSYYNLYVDQVDSAWDAFTGNFVYTTTYYHGYVGGLREDSLKRFYIYYPAQSIDTLLFDFNLSVGDSLPDMQSNYGCNNPPMTVDSIDTVYLGSQALKTFQFPLFPNIKLYEGIGATQGLIWAGTLCQHIDWGPCLIAYKKGLDSLYINCGLGTTGIAETINKNLISIYPNPNAGVFTISDSPVFTNGEINIYNLLGDKIYSDKISGNTKKEIHLDNISSGIYFVKVSDGGKTYCKKLIIQKD